MRNINRKQLKNRCQQSISQIFTDCKKIGGKIIGQKNQQYAYIDNGADILLVCHADTVFDRAKYSQDNQRIYSPNLDDRLGVYLLLDYFPHIGINADILITENEEIGQTTAENFTTEKAYNWIVEFDRCGSGAVAYDYDSPDWLGAIARHFTIHQGSFSDISALENLKTSAVNIGIAYHHEHRRKCYCRLSELYRQLQKFVAFYLENCKIRYAHEPKQFGFCNYTDFDYFPDNLLDNLSNYYCPSCDSYLDNDEIIDCGSDCNLCGYCYGDVIIVQDIQTSQDSQDSQDIIDGDYIYA